MEEPRATGRPGEFGQELGAGVEADAQDEIVPF